MEPLIIAMSAGTVAGLASLAGSFLGSWVSDRQARDALAQKRADNDRRFELARSEALSAVAKQLEAAHGASHYQARVTAAERVASSVAVMVEGAAAMQRVLSNPPGAPTFHAHTEWLREHNEEILEFQRGSAVLRVLGSDETRSALESVGMILRQIDSASVEAQGKSDQVMAMALTDMADVVPKLEEEAERVISALSSELRASS